jgi:hypothetical protein
MLNLEQFSGGDTHYRHGLVRGVTYTEGAKHVAETAGVLGVDLAVVAVRNDDLGLAAAHGQLPDLEGLRLELLVPNTERRP